MSSFVRIDTNSRKETNPTHISYAISHCESLQLLRYLFFPLFHFPSPSGFSHSIPPRSDMYKGSCYFKRSIQYRIGGKRLSQGKEGRVTKSCDVTSTEGIRMCRHIQSLFLFESRFVAFLN